MTRVRRAAVGQDGAVTTPPLVNLEPLTLAVLEALAVDDLDLASALTGLSIPDSLLDQAWLWRLRREQLQHTPSDLEWIVRLVTTADGEVVGHAGFHGGPDEAGLVEIGYSVVVEHRGRGYARAAIVKLLAWAAAEPAVRTLRASVSPDNAASLHLVASHGFVCAGEQWGDVDGIELILERPAR